MKPEDIAFGEKSLLTRSGPPVRITWLGTAGFRIEHEGTTLLIDPYLTRASLFYCATGPLRSDRRAIAEHAPKADAIIAGHTHFDHVLDVPAIARATGAKVFGSRSCVHLCRAEGVAEEKVVDVESSSAMRAEVGPFELRFVPSVHSAFALGRVPFPGDIADCEHVPLWTHHYKCGAVFSVDIRVAGRRIVHLGSANLRDEKLEAGADLMLMCVAGWTTTEKFVPRVMKALAPGAILLSHWDDFFSPIGKGAKALPAMAMPRLVESLSAVDRSVRIGTVPMLGTISL